MEQKEKAKGYLAYNDSKSVLQVFAQEDKDLGYELALELDYGTDRGYVERVLFKTAQLIELENLKEIIQSDKFMVKFK